MMGRATMYDFRDLDLMMRIADSADQTVSRDELAEAIGLDGDNGSQSVAVRLSWMRRYGFLDYDERAHRWGLSSSGRRITAAQLKAAQRRTLEAVPDDSMVEVMSHVTARYRRGDEVMANLLRREFLFGTQRSR